MEIQGVNGIGAATGAGETGKSLNMAAANQQATNQQDYKGGMTMQQAADRIGVGLNQLGGALRTWEALPGGYEKIGLSNTTVEQFEQIMKNEGPTVLLKELSSPSVKITKQMGAGTYVYSVNSGFGSSMVKTAPNADAGDPYKGGVTMQEAANQLAVPLDQLGGALRTWEVRPVDHEKIGLSNEAVNQLGKGFQTFGAQTVLTALKNETMKMLTQVPQGQGENVFDLDASTFASVMRTASNSGVAPAEAITADPYKGGVTMQEAANQLGVPLDQLGGALRTWEARPVDHEKIGLSDDAVNQLQTSFQALGAQKILAAMKDGQGQILKMNEMSSTGTNVFELDASALANIQREASYL